MAFTQFHVRTLMFTVASAALIVWRVEIGMVLVLSLFAMFAGYVLRTALAGSHERRWAASYLVIVASLYLPYTWVLGEFLWSPIRLGWVELWPVLPGFFAAMVVPLSDARLARLFMAITALLCVGLLTIAGSQSRERLTMAASISSIGSAFLSLDTYLVCHLGAFL